MNLLIFPFTLWLGSLGSIDSNAPPLLVDIRSQAAFEQLHIPGSVNISLEVLKQKAWLGQNPIRLIAEQTADLHDELEALRKLGFKDVEVQEAGLYGYLLKGGRLEGDPRSNLELGMLNTVQFMVARQKQTWTLVALEQPESGVLPDDFVQLEASEPTDLAQHLADLAKSNPGRKILLVDRNGALKDQILSLLREVKHSGIFYFDGGFQQWGRLFAQPGTGSSSQNISANVVGAKSPETKKDCGCGKK